MTEKRDNRWKAGVKRKRDWYPIDKREEKQPILYDKVHDWLLDPANRQRLEDHLDWYLTRYQGRHFEWFSSETNGQRFSSFHVLAAESLSVKVPSTSARWLLEPDIRRDELLDRIHQSLVPGADALWNCDQALLEGDQKRLELSGALYELYWNLRTLGTYDFSRGGIGRVTTSKLLAAMFPAVVPIRDSMVDALLGLSDHDNWWTDLRSLFQADGEPLIQLLDGLRIPEESGDVTTLRRLDIILWMEANARGLTPKGQRERSIPGMEEE